MVGGLTTAEPRTPLFGTRNLKMKGIIINLAIRCQISVSFSKMHKFSLMNLWVSFLFRGTLGLTSCFFLVFTETLQEIDVEGASSQEVVLGEGEGVEGGVDYTVQVAAGDWEGRQGPRSQPQVARLAEGAGNFFFFNVVFA